MRKIDHVKANLLNMGSQYPIKSSPDVQPSEFYTILNKGYPTILNWPHEMVQMAISQCNDGTFVGVGFSQEVNIHDDDENVFPQVDVDLNDVPQVPHNESNLYHHMMTYVNDICKYSKKDDVQLRKYIDIIMNNLVQKTIMRSQGVFNVNEYLQQYDDERDGNPMIDSGTTIENVIAEQPPNDNENQTIQFLSSLPPLDNSTVDSRIKYGFER